MPFAAKRASRRVLLFALILFSFHIDHCYHINRFRHASSSLAGFLPAIAEPFASIIDIFFRLRLVITPAFHIDCISYAFRY